MENIEKLIDLVENTAPKCTLGIDTEVYFKDDDGVIDSYACQLELCWYNQSCEVAITAPYCTISPPYDNRYDIETVVIDGTSADWEYWFSVTGLSSEEEDELKDLMESRLCTYDLKSDNVAVNIEHY